MTATTQTINFRWPDADPTGSHSYLLPRLKEILSRRVVEPSRTRLIDIGCGNGAVTNVLRSGGFDVVGIDPSSEGVEQARRAHSGLRVELGSAYDNLLECFGAFDVVVSLEVIEHLYSPHMFAENIERLLRPGGFAVVSTPYHGYLKNLALAITGKWDFHHHPLAEHGHIKFWSKRTLEELMAKSHMRAKEFYRLGRVPALGKSMMLVFEKETLKGDER
jgi:2-polyprenyl-3-methyl-5-hydroxy-6-metoxy-1,4-benzoquinol methylase